MTCNLQKKIYNMIHCLGDKATLRSDLSTKQCIQKRDPDYTKSGFFCLWIPFLVPISDKPRGFGAEPQEKGIDDNSSYR